MAFYFYCPGSVTASATTVQCSVEVQSYEPPASATWLTGDNVASFIGIALTYHAIFFVFRQIKRAIELA